MKGPRRLDLTSEQIESLISRVENQELKAEDYPLLVDLIRAMIWIQGALVEKQISIARLRKIFGIKTESAKALLNIVNGKIPPGKNGVNDPKGAVDSIGGQHSSENTKDDKSASENAENDEDPSKKEKKAMVIAALMNIKKQKSLKLLMNH